MCFVTWKALIACSVFSLNYAWQCGLSGNLQTACGPHMLLSIQLLKHCPETQTPLLAHIHARAWSDISPSMDGQEVGASRSSANLLLLLFLMAGWTAEHISRHYASCVRGREMMKCLGSACGCRCVWGMKVSLYMCEGGGMVTRP